MIKYNYKNGKLDGDKIHYYPYSDKPKVETYENGLIISSKMYREKSGEVISELDYVYVTTSRYKEYSDCGKLVVEGQYENDKKVESGYQNSTW